MQGTVYKTLRLSDNKLLAAKFIKIDVNGENKDLRKYMEREVTFQMSLNNEFIMKMEDKCFLA